MSKHQTPTPPTPIKIGLMRFDVSIDQAAVDRESAQKGEELAGVSVFSDAAIYLAEGLSKTYAQDTLLHEMMHMALRASGVNPDGDAHANLDDVEERAILGMTGPLLEALQDPAVAAYLAAD